MECSKVSTTRTTQVSNLSWNGCCTHVLYSYSSYFDTKTWEQNPKVPLDSSIKVSFWWITGKYEMPIWPRWFATGHLRLPMFNLTSTFGIRSRWLKWILHTVFFWLAIYLQCTKKVLELIQAFFDVKYQFGVTINEIRRDFLGSQTITWNTSSSRYTNHVDMMATTFKFGP